MYVHSLLATAAVSLLGLFQPSATQPAASSLPSAHGGVIVALGVLREVAPECQMDILSLTAESLAKGRKMGPHVALKMDLRLHSTDAGAAEKAMEAFEAALEKRAKVTEAPSLGYMEAVGALTRMKFRAEHLKGYKNAYRTTIKVKLPAAAIGTTTSVRRTSNATATEASFTNSVGSYVRSIAARGHVGLAPLSMETKGGRWTVKSKRTGKDGKLAPVTVVQAANFLYLLESESKMAVVTEVNFKGPKGSAFSTFSAQLAERK